MECPVPYPLEDIAADCSGNTVIGIERMEAPPARADGIGIDTTSVKNGNLDDNSLFRCIFESFPCVCPEMIIELRQVDSCVSHPIFYRIIGCRYALPAEHIITPSVPHEASGKVDIVLRQQIEKRFVSGALCIGARPPVEILIRYLPTIQKIVPVITC